VLAVGGVWRGVHVENADLGVLVQDRVVLGICGDGVQRVWPCPAA